MIGQGSRRSPVRAACAGRPALVDAAVVVRPGVAIDDQTGVARDDMLRLEERARPGWLDARADFPFLAVGELPLAAEFLLRAGAAAIDSLVLQQRPVIFFPAGVVGFPCAGLVAPPPA